MSYNILTRYGHSEAVTDNADLNWFPKLLKELREEQFEEPDDEHTQVSVSNEHWSVTVQVSGLITFDNIDLLEGEDSDLPESMYLRDLPDETVYHIWESVTQTNKQKLLSFNWKQFEDLESFQNDYYRI